MALEMQMLVSDMWTDGWVFVYTHFCYLQHITHEVHLLSVEMACVNRYGLLIQY